MTGQRETIRYATPALRHGSENHWFVAAQPWQDFVGTTSEHESGWTATTNTGRYAGLWPTKQAAAEVLVKQAGYELELG